MSTTRAWLDSKRQYYLSNSKSTPSTIGQQQQQQQQNHHQLHIGDRVQVNSLYGTIRFIGTTKFKAGTWAGIELDNIGLGKNDGSVDGKRYFICPPNTGIFILAIKVLKQNRPSTPYNNNTKKIMTSPATPIPTPTSTTTLLQKKIEELEIENKSLKQTINDIKSASMDSIEILENMIQSHQNTISDLENNLKNEKLKFKNLEKEQNDIKKVGLEAIELTISELENSNQKSEKLIIENELQSKNHHKEIQILLQDISVLENVLQNKMDNEIYLLNSLKKEKQQNLKLSIELNKKIGYSTTTTTIHEEEEEEEEDNHCTLCDHPGHSLIHCNVIM